jgi:predicted RNase H-like HicB family nuclease
MISYAVQLATRYDGLVIASFPDLPGVSALGRDDEEALAEAGRALEDALAGYVRDGMTPPAPIARAAVTVSVAAPLPLPA